jgi:hypothetical protein
MYLVLQVRRFPPYNLPLIDVYHIERIHLSEYEKKIDFQSILKALYEKGASAWCKNLFKLPV